MKKKQELISYWVKAADYDLTVAKHLFEKGDYPYCLFFGHLVIEKTLKALYVKNVDVNPPYKHSLVRLAHKVKLDMDEKKTEFLETITGFNIEARYPDKKFSFYQLCTKEFTANHFQKIKDFYQWLKGLIQSDP